jgi:hypothetical protein
MWFSQDEKTALSSATKLKKASVYAKRNRISSKNMDTFVISLMICQMAKLLQG